MYQSIHCTYLLGGCLLTQLLRLSLPLGPLLFLGLLLLCFHLGVDLAALAAVLDFKGFLFHFCVCLVVWHTRRKILAKIGSSVGGWVRVDAVLVLAGWLMTARPLGAAGACMVCKCVCTILDDYENVDG